MLDHNPNPDELVFYRSQIPGLVITLPGDLPNVTFEASTLKPGEPQYGLARLKKTDTAIIKAVENHPRFNKSISRLKTADELEEEKRLAKAAEFVENLKISLASGLVELGLKNKTKDDLFEFANQVGISVMDGKKEKTNAALITEIENLLGVSETEKK